MSHGLAAEVTRALFDAPLLRGLDARDRDAIERVARPRALRGGEMVFEAGAIADAVFVVLRGAVTLLGQRRGDVSPTVIRVARAGETFGEDALVLAAGRSLSARADGDVEVIEVPRTVLERAFGRGGPSAVASRELRFAQRAAHRDLLRMIAFARDLEPTDLAILLDGARPRRAERGETLYAAGDAAGAFFLILEGLVQLQAPDPDGNPVVRAYLARGDFFGDEEVLFGDLRATSAVATGVSQLMEVPRAVLETLRDRNPRLLARVRRIHAERVEEQRAALGDGGALTTQHVFRDAYRMQMARSLLVIDQDRCVRCGHCASSCESLYGVSRLVRRGDKIVARPGGPAAPETSLLLPSSCQHCKNPLCMVDCPTGAIGRDPEGEVFIREELCVGCGNCAKACPWDNIRMAPRPAGAPVAESLRRSTNGGSGFSEIAVKCDLCRGYEAPACVSACPTEAIFRLEPTQDIREVASLFGMPEASAQPEKVTRAAARPWSHPLARAFVWLLSGLSFGLVFVAYRAHEQGALVPSSGLGYASGWAALLAMVGLAAYVVPKRAMSRFLRPRATGSRRGARAARSAAPRSWLRPHYLVHVGLGVGSVVLVVAHAGLSFHVSASGALGVAFFLTAALGLLGAVGYRVLPRRLSRLERRGMLPEDLEGERERLFDEMHREASGRSDLIKAILSRMLVPYARSPWGAYALLFSGRSRDEEEKRLEGDVREMLEGRGTGKLAGITSLLKVVVELRSLPARRLLSRVLRDWLPVHLLLSGLLLGLLLIHVLGALRP